MSAESWLCQFGKLRSCSFNFQDLLLGVSIWKPSSFYAQESLLPAIALPGLGADGSWSGIEFSPLQYANTLFWPFWLYSRQGACQAVLVVLNLLALP